MLCCGSHKGPKVVPHPRFLGPKVVPHPSRGPKGCAAVVPRLCRTRPPRAQKLCRTPSCRNFCAAVVLRLCQLQFRLLKVLFYQYGWLPAASCTAKPKTSISPGRKEMCTPARAIFPELDFRGVPKDVFGAPRTPKLDGIKRH